MPHVEREVSSPARPVAHAAAGPSGPGRTAALVRAHAANDASCVDGRRAAGVARVAAPSIVHAAAAPSARHPSSRDLHRKVAGPRSRLLGKAIVAAVLAIGRLALRLRDAYRTHRRAAATCASLDELDARTLHDLGLDRSEISSLAAEIARRADTTRMQAMLASHGLYR